MSGAKDFIKIVIASTVASLVLLVGLRAGDAGSAFSSAEAKTQPAVKAKKGTRAPPPSVPSAFAQTEGTLAGEIPVGDALSVNGQPMELSIFMTSDAVDKVVGYYSEVFKQRSLLPIARTEGGLGHVSVFDPEDGLQHFVNALPHGKETMVMLGTTSPKHPPRMFQGAASAPFPVPQQHRGFMGFASEDGGQSAQSGQYVTTLSTSELRDYYRKELVQGAGFTQVANTGDAYWVFDHPGVSITVAVQALDEKQGAAVFVNRIEGEQQ